MKEQKIYQYILDCRMADFDSDYQNSKIKESNFICQKAKLNI